MCRRCVLINLFTFQRRLRDLTPGGCWQLLCHPIWLVRSPIPAWCRRGFDLCSGFPFCLARLGVDMITRYPSICLPYSPWCDPLPFCCFNHGSITTPRAPLSSNNFLSSAPHKFTTARGYRCSLNFPLFTKGKTFSIYDGLRDLPFMGGVSLKYAYDLFIMRLEASSCCTACLINALSGGGSMGATLSD